ncbi:MAG: amidohydrolase family protein, partial [Prolixibacteraceae bacterium]|nr:amidohydrolase family protein [Prolixibacteraceae bacterium]
VNAHCHLELSYLQNKISENTGIGGFIGAINKLRTAITENIEEDIRKADLQCRASGTVAVGDVSNTQLTLNTKINSKIFYHTFSEAFGFLPSRSETAFSIACFIEDFFRDNGLKTSVVPHSPYSVSEPLLRKIADKAKNDKSILTIHNQESQAENQFFQNGKGPIADHLTKNLGIDISEWKPLYKNSLKYILHTLSRENQLLLVHNTFTSEADIAELKKQRKLSNTYFVLCPNSNLYIENHLPPVCLFKKENLNICIGTDSLASNHHLSVLEEMITIQKYFPDVTLEELVRWACHNGACALMTENQFGTFEPGKKPGINLITDPDLQNLKLTGNSKVRRLV